MSKKRFTPEQIISMLRKTEAELSQGQTICIVCRGLGILVANQIVIEITETWCPLLSPRLGSHN